MTCDTSKWGEYSDWCVIHQCEPLLCVSKDRRALELQNERLKSMLNDIRSRVFQDSSDLACEIICRIDGGTPFASCDCSWTAHGKLSKPCKEHECNCTIVGTPACRVGGTVYCLAVNKQQICMTQTGCMGGFCGKLLPCAEHKNTTADMADLLAQMKERQKTEHCYGAYCRYLTERKCICLCGPCVEAQKKDH